MGIQMRRSNHRSILLLSHIACLWKHCMLSTTATLRRKNDNKCANCESGPVDELPVNSFISILIEGRRRHHLASYQQGHSCVRMLERIVRLCTDNIAPIAGRMGWLGKRMRVNCIGTWDLAQADWDEIVQPRFLPACASLESLLFASYYFLLSFDNRVDTESNRL